jgi:membrane protein DedA with SNARE-associated domain
VFDWLSHVQASPLTYVVVLGACALDAVLPIVPSEAVVIAASVLAAKGELSIWLVVLAAAAGGFLGRHGFLCAWWHRWRRGRSAAVSEPQGQASAHLGR